MMNILVTLNANYLPPLKVLLHSLFCNNKDESFSIYLLYSDIPDQDIKALEQYIISKGHRFTPIFVDSKWFQDAPVFRHYTSEMYYRLAAYQFLPEDVDRILYLDPDIVCINPITDFYWTDFENCLFVAAEHEHSAKMARAINKLRLRTPNAKGYFNTGVLLMNMASIRKEVNIEEIYQFIEKNKLKLVLPDQDVLNALYWDKIKPADSLKYNYDARYYELSKLIPKRKHSIDWIRRNTVLIHYCGKDKPWHKQYKNELKCFYDQYKE
ncbi:MULTISPECIES: glycosyltransferase family 8 protein [Bacillus]|uniref:Glycosyl transferase family 8 n=1 Tax=Bacillus smithii 7_3_47FAA TaxID=665952 RepID=G9QNJ6_9BACI|nr:glycosyltransferase family 8 protein [Bacillus smithii]EHL75925.1 hypothetical protein HMPREF1015_02739 [Bacillus smithii 7_3_47FAA]